ncbi:MAG: zinc-dependent metalloprotease [Prolixibacteraceae bacterium]|nr:zinc-dependent metalloprotease [Prolixibacteraceae bacterium]
MKKIIKLLIGLIISLTPIMAFGQNQSLFEIENENQISYKKEVLNKIENLKKNRLYKSVQIIELTNVPELTKKNNGTLPVKIPDINKLYIAEPVDIKFISDENFIWKGNFIKEKGIVKLICKNNEIFGNIQVGGRFFEIQSFESGKNIIIEYNEEELAKSTCGNFCPEENVGDEILSIENTLKSTAATTTRANVRVLVLYTDSADAAVYNINNTIGLAIAQINDAISNSAISSNLIVTLAGVEYFNFTETNNIGIDVNSLSNNQTVASLRNSYEADLVILMTDGNYNNGVYYIYGMVKNIGPINADAYAIVEADHATSSHYTFAHEIGHLFGGLHNTDQNGTYEHGYFFYTGIWPFGSYKYTIMASCGDNPRILHYSNPNVQYQNVATGTTEYNNVARKLRVEAPTVEGFRQSVPLLSVFISGPTVGNNLNMYTWYANVSGGTSPYSYSWNLSLDGYTYQPTVSQSSSYSGRLPYNNNLYLRVTVSSSDGQSAVDFHTTINRGSIEELKSVSTSSKTSDSVFIKSQESSLAPIELAIYPNPLENISTISYYIYEDTLVYLEIYNSNGRRINTLLNGRQEKGSHSLNFSTSKYKSGIYLCKLSIEGRTITKKIIVK